MDAVYVLNRVGGSPDTHLFTEAEAAIDTVRRSWQNMGMTVEVNAGIVGKAIVVRDWRGDAAERYTLVRKYIYVAPTHL